MQSCTGFLGVVGPPESKHQDISDQLTVYWGTFHCIRKSVFATNSSNDLNSAHTFSDVERHIIRCS